MKKHWSIAWTHIRRSPYQALAAIAVMTLTFFVASVVFLAAAGSQVALRYFETRPQVTAFFKDEVSLDQIEVLKTKLNQTGKVEKIRYVSKEEALAIYREQNKNDPLLLEMVTASILPSSLEVSTTDLSYLQEIADLLQNEPQIQEVIFQEDVVSSLKDWTISLRRVGLILIGFLFFVSLLIILAIISMKVALKKQEIITLPLVGANKSYVSASFVLEGIFYGLTGAFLAWGSAYLVLLYSSPFLLEFFAGLPLLPVPVFFMLYLLAGELLTGVMIGSLGGWLAVRRYLK